MSNAHMEEKKTFQKGSLGQGSTALENLYPHCAIPELDQKKNSFTMHLIYFKQQIEDSVDLLPNCLEPLGVDVRISCEDQSQDVAAALERGLWFC